MIFHNMNKRKPILSIAIPTYNRPSMIFEQVEELSTFIIEEDLSELIEIVVVDNNSEHNIFKVLNNFLVHDFLKVFKNEENLGMSKNIIRTIEESNGLFYYFIGDDDRIDYVGMKNLLKLLLSKYIDSDLLIALNPCISLSKYFFNALREHEDQISDTSLDLFQIYYVANACSFVKTSLCKKFIDENSEIASSLPIPQAMCAAYAVIKTGKLIKINYPIIRKTEGEEYINNIVSSWSIFYTRIVIPKMALSKMASAYRIRLDKKSIFYRQPELRPFNFFSLIPSIVFLNWFIDSDLVRENFRVKLRGVSDINVFYKNTLKITTSNTARNIGVMILKYLCLAKFRFALNINSKILQKMAKINESGKNKSIHDWGLGNL